MTGGEGVALVALVALVLGLVTGWWLHAALGPRRAPGRAPGSTGPTPVSREEVESLRSDLAALVRDVGEVVTAVESLLPRQSTPAPGCPRCAWTSGHAPGCLSRDTDPLGMALAPRSAPAPRCPEPHGTFQCALPAGHTGRHRTTPSTPADLGAPAAPERAPDPHGQPKGPRSPGHPVHDPEDHPWA